MPLRQTPLVLLLCCTLTSAHAQTPEKPVPKPTPTGSVTGLIICTDTNAPARFATVIPIPIPPPGAAASAPPPVVTGRNITRTDISGRYTLKQLAPGDYLVIAELDGYETPVAGISLHKLSTHDPAAIQQLSNIIPSTHVDPGKQATANLTLHRGAMISGIVTYDDGTPAINTEVSIQPAAATSEEYVPVTGLGTNSHYTTDSLGHYTIPGLPEGHYILRAAINPDKGMMNMLSERWYEELDPGDTAADLAIYPPNTLHRKAAAVCDLKQGESQQVDIEIPLDGLRAVTGVVMADPTEPPPISGAVFAQADDDPDIERAATIHADGSFQFLYLPSSKYTLTTNPSNLAWGSRDDGSPKQKRFPYPRATTDVDITKSDAPNVIITIPPVPPPKKSTSPAP